MPLKNTATQIHKEACANNNCVSISSAPILATNPPSHFDIFDTPKPLYKPQSSIW